MTHLTAVATDPVEPFQDPDLVDGFQGRAKREGTEFKAHALDYLVGLGCMIVQAAHHVARYPVDALVETPNRQRLLVAAHGVFDDGPQAGLRRTDTVHKLGHRAHALARRHAARLVVVTSHLPEPGSAAAGYLADLHDDLGPWLVDVVATAGDLAGYHRLARYLHTDPVPEPAPAPWWQASPVVQTVLEFAGPAL